MKCKKSEESKDLLNLYALETDKIMRNIDFLPYVTINEKHFDSALFRENTLVKLDIFRLI